MILTDAPAYTEWDSGVVRMEGSIGLGEKFKLFAAINPKRGFAIKVSEFVPGQGMTQLSGMPLGLFKGVRTLTLTRQADGSTQFEVRERFSGPLLQLTGRAIPDLNPSLQQFAAGLKQCAGMQD